MAHIRCTCFDLIQTCSPAKMQRLRDLAHLFESLLERRRNDPSLEHFGEPEPLDSPCALDGIYAGLDQLFPPTLQWGITGHRDVQGDASRPFVLVDPPHAVDARTPRAVATVRPYRGFRDDICEHVVDIRVKYYDVFHPPGLRISYVWRSTRLRSPCQASVLATSRQRNGLVDILMCQPHHDQALSSAADSSKVFKYSWPTLSLIIDHPLWSFRPSA